MRASVPPSSRLRNWIGDAWFTCRVVFGAAFAETPVASPEAESELAVGFFGSRYERATPGEREYLQAMAELASGRDEPVSTAAGLFSFAASSVATCAPAAPLAGTNVSSGNPRVLIRLARRS